MDLVKRLKGDSPRNPSL
jgi:hypothetical protein